MASRRNRGAEAIHLLLLALALALAPPGGLALQRHRAHPAQFLAHSEVQAAAAAAAIPPLECFEVTHPICGPAGPLFSAVHGPRLPDGACNVVLVHHSFANSYGSPFVGQYTPPQCQFDSVVLNLTITSAGRQFDRLALLYLGDIEIWRTSTAEPRPHPGIVWTIWKDTSAYRPLWKLPQKVIFDLGNLINDVYTGPFNATLTATYFLSAHSSASSTGPGHVRSRTAADLILPISARRASMNGSSAWSYPSDRAVTSLAIPPTARRAVLTVSASGQADEEFWFANAMETDVDTFLPTAGTLPGMSPFREVQVYMDDQLVGVQWPYPVVFTGGVSPTLHRPIVGIGAFDLRQLEIDMTPWLPLLCDGAEHAFEIKVVGLDDDGCNAHLAPIRNPYWVLTGTLFLWLDDDAAPMTTGLAPSVLADPPLIYFWSATTPNTTGHIETLRHAVWVERHLAVHGELVSSSADGSGTVNATPVSWSQSLLFDTGATWTQFGFNQSEYVNISGTDQSTGVAPYKRSYLYADTIQTAMSPDPASPRDFNLSARLNQSISVTKSGASLFGLATDAFADDHSHFDSSSIDSDRWSHGTFRLYNNGRNGSGHGETNQVYHVTGRLAGAPVLAEPVLLYQRAVVAANDSVVSDNETVAITPSGPASAVADWVLGSQDRLGPDPVAGAPDRIKAGFSWIQARGLSPVARLVPDTR